MPDLTRGQAAELNALAWGALSARCAAARNCMGPGNARAAELPAEVDAMQMARRWIDHTHAIVRAPLSPNERQMLADARGLNPDITTRQVDDLLYGRTTLADIYQSRNPVGSHERAGAASGCPRTNQEKAA